MSSYIAPRPRRLLSHLVAAGALVLTLAACARVEPFDYTPIDEIPPGPGLLSGDDGELVLYGD